MKREKTALFSLAPLFYSLYLRSNDASLLSCYGMYCAWECEFMQVWCAGTRDRLRWSCQSWFRAGWQVKRSGVHNVTGLLCLNRTDRLYYLLFLSDSQQRLLLPLYCLLMYCCGWSRCPSPPAASCRQDQAHHTKVPLHTTYRVLPIRRCDFPAPISV